MHHFLTPTWTWLSHVSSDKCIGRERKRLRGRGGDGGGGEGETERGRGREGIGREGGGRDEHIYVWRRVEEEGR